MMTPSEADGEATSRPTGSASGRREQVDDASKLLFMRHHFGCPLFTVASIYWGMIDHCPSPHRAAR